MVGLLMAALLLAGGSSAPEELTDLCSLAIDSAMEEQDPGKMHERFVGRLEIEMEDAGLSAQNKEAGRIVCRAYMLGVVKGIGILNKELDKQNNQR